MNPKHKRAADRLRELITEGKQVAALEGPAQYVGSYIQDKVALHSWLVKVQNIVVTIFKQNGAHSQHLEKVTKRNPERVYEINTIIGILPGALSDLEGGYLVGQEHLIAGEIFDSVLEQAKHLTKNGFKDPAAVLARVVIEDCLRRISHEEGLDNTGKASALNDALRDKGRYPKPQWRLIQSWLDIGNSAAHGKFDEFTEDAVARMIDDVDRFLAQELRP